MKNPLGSAVQQARKGRMLLVVRKDVRVHWYGRCAEDVEHRAVSLIERSVVGMFRMPSERCLHHCLVESS